MENREIFAAIAKNDQKIIKQFIDTCWPMIRRLVQNMDSSNYLDARDIFQDALVVVINGIRKGKLQENQMTASLSTYIYSVVRNLSLDRIKKMKSAGDLNDLINVPKYDATGDELYLQRQQHILELVERIKPPCNKMLIDNYVHRMSYEDIAVKYGYKNYNSAKKKNGECLKWARRLVESDKYLKAKFFINA